MKRVLMIIVALVPLMVFAQRTTIKYSWIIPSIEVGQGIIHSPNGEIDGQKNYGYLFITAPEGAEVVAPCDGVVKFVSLTYYPSLNQCSMIGKEEGESFSGALTSVRENQSGKLPNSVLKYITGSITILSADGRVITIIGLEGNEVFEEGQTIKAGQKIGTIAYSYSKISEPSINFSVTEGGRYVDPMTPFGIPTTFVRAGK